MAADTGASAHYTTRNMPAGAGKIKCQPMQVVLPNSQTLRSEKTAMLPEPHQLPEEARTATVLPNLSEGSLTSIGQHCDHGHQVSFDKNKVKVKHKGELVQQGERNHIKKLWHFHPPTNHHLNYIVPKTNAEN